MQGEYPITKVKRRMKSAHYELIWEIPYKMSELVYLTATVYGEVKGVYYRAFTSQLAKSLGLRGYIRNLPQMNALEVNVEGPKDKIEELIRQLEVGPPE